MINNKLITIIKDNQFDKGWTLFKRHELGIDKNWAFKEVSLSNIVKLITYADEVNLILCEPCLSSRIVNEIKWANKYIKLNVIAKSESVINRYQSFEFTSQKIDKSIDINYISIYGKESGCYIISDAYIEVDGALEKVYFQNKSLKSDYSFFKNVVELIIVDKEAKKDYNELIVSAQEKNIKCIYATDVQFFDKKVFDFAKANNLELLVSNVTGNGVVLVNNDSTLSRLLVAKGGYFVIYPIEKISAFLGQKYKCCFFDDFVDSKMINNEIYSCLRGKLKKLNIIEKKIIPVSVDVKLMSDFVDESFDCSVVESHNEFSAEASKVEYQFTLIPPIIDSRYLASNIYCDVYSLNKKWDLLQKLNRTKIKVEYETFMFEDFGLIDFLNESETFSAQFDKRVSNCDYKCFYSWLEKGYKLFNYFNLNLLEICKKMFNSINEESLGTKFDKFDNEIAGYEQTIKEKEVLIRQGIDVLSNRRRIEILTKKINDLIELKKRFEGNTSSRNDKNLASFIAKCTALLSNQHKSTNNDSIGNIVKPKEETKVSKLEAFVDEYLYIIKRYVEECLLVLGDLKNVHIPEEYPVYDKDGERYIVIDDISEYEKTKDLCNEFSLKCITRG